MKSVHQTHLTRARVRAEGADANVGQLERVQDVDAKDGGQGRSRNIHNPHDVWGKCCLVAH